VSIIVSSALGFDVLTLTALFSGFILAAGIATIIQSKGIGSVGTILVGGVIEKSFQIGRKMLKELGYDV